MRCSAPEAQVGRALTVEDLAPSPELFTADTWK
jgi:hypothetical protein